MTSGGAAQAAGTIGQANALTGGLSTYLNYNQGNSLLNALNRNNTGGGSLMTEPYAGYNASVGL